MVGVFSGKGTISHPNVVILAIFNIRPGESKSWTHEGSNIPDTDSFIPSATGGPSFATK